MISKTNNSVKHLDFTIDFETCGLSANAAVMQVALVPWMRDGESPFFDSGELEPYVGYVDLRTCVVDGFDFDPSTVSWWAGQDETAKSAVTAGMAEPIADVLLTVLDYIRDAVAERQLDSICLWAQGPDVDLAILRNICRRYDVSLEDTVPHASFRDCRTVILESAVAGRPGASVLSDPSKAYDALEPLPETYAGVKHDALYDAVRSTWYTWQALRRMRRKG